MQQAGLSLQETRGAKLRLNNTRTVSRDDTLRCMIPWNNEFIYDWSGGPVFSIGLTSLICKNNQKASRG